MDDLHDYINDYLLFCAYRKHLDHKTIKAYKIDPELFTEQYLN